MTGKQNRRGSLPAIIPPKESVRSRLKGKLTSWFAFKPGVDPERHAALAEEVRAMQENFATLCKAAKRTERATLSRLGDFAERLEKLERASGGRAEDSAAAAPPADTEKRKRILGWVVRDVQNDIALVEGRNRLVELSPGQKVRGLGEVKTIEREGPNWIVVTTRGVILSEQNESVQA